MQPLDMLACIVLGCFGIIAAIIILSEPPDGI